MFYILISSQFLLSLGIKPMTLGIASDNALQFELQESYKKGDDHYLTNFIA